MSLNPKLTATVLFAALGTLCATAQAALTWRFDTGDPNQAQCVSGCNGGSWQSSIEFATSTLSPTGPNVTVQGWANTLNNSAGVLQSQQQQGEITRYGGGVGIRNADYNTGGDPNEGSQPEHAVDNEDRYDWVLMDFGADKIALNSVDLDWPSTTYDTDMTVLFHEALVGSDSALAGKSFQQLMDAGWKLAAQLANVGTDSPAAFNNDNLQISSHWLVGAFNPYFPDPSSPMTWTTNNDYMKIAAVSGTVMPGPPHVTVINEPAPLALIAIGGFAMVGVRFGRGRRRIDL